MKRFRRWLRFKNLELNNRYFLLRRKIITTFGETGKFSMRWLKFLSALLLAGVFFGYTFHYRIPVVLSMAIITLIFYLILTVAFKLLDMVRNKIKYFSTGLVLALLTLGYGVYRWLSATESKGITEGWEIPVIVVTVVIMEWLFSKGIYAVFINKKRNPFSYLLLIFTLTFNLMFFWFLFTDGPESEEKRQMFALLPEIGESYEPERGDYEEEIIDYSPESNLSSPTISVLPYVNYSGWSKRVRDFIWKKDLSEVPVAGRLYLPKGKKNAPLLVFVHGNHRMTEENHLGYHYLGVTLAHRGIAMASVDENMLNGFYRWGLGGENDARAILLLENVKWLLDQSENMASPLYDSFDPEKVALGGHSRGGEAAATAAYFQTIDRLPESGFRKLDYKFGIDTVIAVSPTNGQYQPGGRQTVLKDVNYMVLHGSHDGDINTFQGEEQYHSVLFSGEEEHFKTAIYIGYANHGQFNSLWGKNDTELPGGLLYHKGDLLYLNAQRIILSDLVYHFLNVSFGGEDREIFLEDPEKLTGIKTVYSCQYADERFTPFNDYEEDGDIETATVPGGRNYAEGLWKWSESEVEYSNSSRRSGNHGVNLSWASPRGVYGTEFSEPLSLGEGLRFNVRNTDEEAMAEFTLELTDSAGEKATAEIDDSYGLYPAIPTGLLKIQHLTKNWEYKSAFRTISVPAEVFRRSNPRFDESSVKELKFMFNLSDNGNIIIDEVGMVH